jgi:hypothetical protein
MCCGRYQEAGSPKIDNEKVRRLAALKPAIDEFGHLHIIVDDWNLEDSHIKFCRREVEQNSKNESERERQEEREFLDLMATMSLDERYSAFAIEGGCWVPS